MSYRLYVFNDDRGAEVGVAAQPDQRRAPWWPAVRVILCVDVPGQFRDLSSALVAWRRSQMTDEQRAADEADDLVITLD